MSNILRVCLDLNIWCAALLADGKGRENTASQSLVAMIRQGICLSQPVQLVISWGMLNRLRKVLTQDLKVSEQTTDFYLSTIAAYAHLGALGASPQLTLGGTGVIPLRDTEDAHVLETAIAGRADFLVTANFKDFIMEKTAIVSPNRYALHQGSDSTIHIVHPYLMMEWLRTGIMPEPNKESSKSS
jgi:predicted nucleic acid-binding protein